MTLSRRIFTLLASLVFVATAAVLILEAKRNHEIKGTLAAIEEEMTRVHAAGLALKAGEVLDPLELPNLTGEKRRVAYEDAARDTILLIFSPECPACKQNFENWKTLEAAHDAARGDLYYISTLEPEQTVDFAREHALREVLLADQQTLSRYKVEEIPTTILVGPGGVVKKVWVGVLPSEALAELGGARS